MKGNKQVYKLKVLLATSSFSGNEIITFRIVYVSPTPIFKLMPV